MKWWEKVKAQVTELWDADVELPITESSVSVPILEVVKQEPFVSFPCEKCHTQIDLQEKLEPGQVAVLECDNCGASWSIVLPSIQIFDTTKYEPVWKHTAQAIGGSNGITSN